MEEILHHPLDLLQTHRLTPTPQPLFNIGDWCKICVIGPNPENLFFRRNVKRGARERMLCTLKSGARFPPFIVAQTFALNYSDGEAFKSKLVQPAPCKFDCG